MNKLTLSIATIILSIFLLNFTLALDLEINQTNKDQIAIFELNTPITLDLSIKNLDNVQNIEIYNLLGFEMTPNKFTIEKDETKQLSLQIKPIGEFKQKGMYTFKYTLRAQDETEIERQLSFKIVPMEEIFKIGTKGFNPESETIQVYIKNTLNINFDSVNAEFSSTFFDITQDFTLSPNEEKLFDVPLNLEDFKKLQAGFYTLKSTITIEERTAKIEGLMKFENLDKIDETSQDYGILVNTQIITKENKGNVITDSVTTIDKNTFSRFFTTIVPEPTETTRTGLTNHYTWNKKIKPGESFAVTVKTNYLFPLLVIFFIVTIIVLIKKQLRTELTLRKKVTFVKSKSGEFALKITIFVNAKKYVENIKVIDKLPPLSKILKHFGGEEPTSIDNKTRQIKWDFNKLEAGERRLLSYIIYSKVGILGKFALPKVKAFYDKEGDTHETTSNKAFFISQNK